MASLGAFLNLQRRPTPGSLRSFLDVEIPVEQEVNILAGAAEERQKQDEAGPNLRPANPMQSILEQEKVGAFNALQNIPISPLASAVELASPGAYDAMTAPVEGANPEVPNMLAALDQMSLGGLIDTPVAAGLLRTKAPSLKPPTPARLRGRPAGSLGELATAEPFYSQARTVLEDPKTQGTQTGEAWIKFLTDPKRGVKSEEMQYTGLGDFLKGKGGQRVTRDEIQSHLDANEIEIKEITKGAPHEITWEPDTDYPGEILHGRAPDAAKSRYVVMKERSGPRAGKWIMEDSVNPSRVTGTFDTQEAAQRAATYALGMERSGQPKFSQYTLPGAENYREVLLMLSRYQGRFKAVSERLAEISKMTPEEVAKRPELVEEFDRLAGEQAGTQPGPAFKSQHWDEEDVLAHLRLSDRTDADGKRTLLVEEIQSDWAQKGRKEGFAEPVDMSKRQELSDRATAIRREAEKMPVRTNEQALAREAAFADARALDEQVNAIDRKRTGVPQGPFVGDTGKWTALGLKRVLKMAADGGYDRIGIVPGVEQAKRYDLSKQVDKLLYKKNSDGTYRVSAQIPGSGGRMLGENIPESKLEDQIGKEVAERIINGQGEAINLGGPGSTSQPKDMWTSLSGEGLRVGGEGMKGYYNKIVPDTLNKLAKEYGVKVNLEGGRVGDSSVRTLDQINADMDANVEEMMRLGHTGERSEALEEKQRKFQEEYNRAKDGEGLTPIHTLDVPEPMKKQIKAKGFPLYSKAGTIGSLIGAQNA